MDTTVKRTVNGLRGRSNKTIEETLALSINNHTILCLPSSPSSLPLSLECLYRKRLIAHVGRNKKEDYSSLFPSNAWIICELKPFNNSLT